MSDTHRSDSETWLWTDHIQAECEIMRIKRLILWILTILGRHDDCVQSVVAESKSKHRARGAATLRKRRVTVTKVLYETRKTPVTAQPANTHITHHFITTLKRKTSLTVSAFLQNHFQSAGREGGNDNAHAQRKNVVGKKNKWIDKSIYSRKILNQNFVLRGFDMYPHILSDLTQTRKIKVQEFYVPGCERHWLLLNSGSSLGSSGRAQRGGILLNSDWLTLLFFLLFEV